MRDPYGKKISFTGMRDPQIYGKRQISQDHNAEGHIKEAEHGQEKVMVAAVKDVLKNTDIETDVIIIILHQQQKDQTQVKHIGLDIGRIFTFLVGWEGLEKGGGKGNQETDTTHM